MYNLAFFFHILGVLIFVAGVAVAGVAFEAARRHGRPGEVAALLGLARVGALLVGAGALVAGAFGLWLVRLGHWGYDSSWVDASIGLFLVALILGGLGGRAPRQARRLAGDLAGRDVAASPPELRALLDDPLSRGANYASLLLVLAIVAVMCFKP